MVENQVMDYQRHYDALIERARYRKAVGYVERHHVVPRCLGGGDEPANLVPLTPEEHFVAHQLLVRLHPENSKLALAALMMTAGKYRSNRLYGWIRRRFSLAMSEMPRTAEQMAACHEGRRRKGTTAEHRHLISSALKGKQKSDAHRQALSIARKNLNYTPELREKLAANKGKKLNDAQYAAFVLSNKGKKLSEDHKAKLRAPKGEQPKVTCPHCAKHGGKSLMMRWHFENCKDKKDGQNQ